MVFPLLFSNLDRDEPSSKITAPVPLWVNVPKSFTTAERSWRMLTSKLDVSSPSKIWELASLVSSLRITELLSFAVTAFPCRLSKVPELVKALLFTKTAWAFAPLTVIVPLFVAVEPLSTLMPWASSPRVVMLPLFVTVEFKPLAYMP